MLRGILIVMVWIWTLTRGQRRVLCPGMSQRKLEDTGGRDGLGGKAGEILRGELVDGLGKELK